MSRTGRPVLSASGLQALAQFETYLGEQDLSAPTLRNYLSDLRQFIAWWEAGSPAGRGFTPAGLDPVAITRYRSYLQLELQLKPATLNRYLISLKRYCAWATESGLLQRDPAKAVKLMDHVEHSPRHLTDQEEEALVAAVTASGNRRDRTLILLMLHTGLRVQEVCELQVEHVERGGGALLQVYGARHKYREVPLDATLRAALDAYLPTVPPGTTYLFPSEKTGEGLTERALGYLIQKYTEQAGLTEVSPHCLRHRFGYRMAGSVDLPRLAQIMGHDSLDTTMIYVRGNAGDR